MIKKWYISTFIIILTILGTVCEQQITVPNQEIVLEFTDVELTSEVAQNTIAIVKKQLQDIGVENIQVNEQESGTLKITYYSDADVESIKKSFSEENRLDIAFVSHNQEDKSSEFPFEENTISYNLNVFEIQNGNDVEWGFNGIVLPEIKSKNDRFFEPNLYFYNSVIHLKELNHIVKEAHKVSESIVIAINNTSHKIPEGRAGPNC